MNTTKTKIAAVLAATFLSTSAFASLIQTTYAGSADFGSGGVGYMTGSIAPTQNSETNTSDVWIGGNSFTTTNQSYDFSATGQFNTWCVDIGSVREICGVAHVVSLAQRILGVMAHVR